MGTRELHYRILGLHPNATAAEVKQAYRRLAKQWHPDRFSTDPAQQQTAASRFQEINAAYAWIKAQGDAPPPPQPARPTTVSTQPLDPRFYYDLAMAAIQNGEDEAAIATLTGHQDTISGLAFNPQGDKLYSSSWDRTIRCWQRQPGPSTMAQ